MPAPLPRARGQQYVILEGPVWDELCDRMEKVEGLKVANGSPLEILDLPGGKVLGMKPRAGEGPTTGQYQFMVYTMVSQNAAGWDFVRAHGILEVEEEE